MKANGRIALSVAAFELASLAANPAYDTAKQAFYQFMEPSKTIERSVGVDSMGIDALLEGVAYAGETERNKASKVNNEGIRYWIKNDYVRAIDRFQESIRIDSEYADAYSNLGGVYLDMGDIDKAFASLNKALELNPDGRNIHVKLAKAYRHIKEYQKALSEIGKAREIDVENNQLTQKVEEFYKRFIASCK